MMFDQELRGLKQMVEILLRGQPGNRANHEIVGPQPEAFAASIAIIAFGIKALQIDPVANDDNLLAATSKQPTLGKQQPANRARLTNDPLTRRFVPHPRNQAEAVHPLDYRANSCLLRRDHPFAPRIYDANIDTIFAQLCDELLVVSFAAKPVAFGPGLIRGRFAITFKNWNAQPLNFSQELAGAKGIEVGLEAFAIKSPQNLETALLLSPKFENVAEKCNS